MVCIGSVVLWTGLAMQLESAPDIVPVQRPAEQVEAPVEAEAPEPEVAEAEAEAEPVEMAAPVSVESVVAVEPVPLAVEPVVEPAAAPPPMVELPERDGHGLLRGSIAAGVVGWGAWAVTFGTVLRGCRGLACGPGAFSTLIGLRWVGNGAALGLAIPGAYYRARYDATAEHLGMHDARDGKAYVWGGAAALGIGAAGWMITRFAAVAAVSEGNFWTPRGYAAYFASLQLSWTAATVGAGLLSYGFAHGTRRKQLGGLASVQVVPQFGRHDGGLSIAGRF